MIGKFKTPEALWQSYQQLERAFTKKCQELNALKKQNSNQQTKTNTPKEVK